MKTVEINFTEAATPEMKGSLLALLERALTLDEIFEEWFLKQGNLFGLSLAVDDAGTVIPDTVSLFLDSGDGTAILSATITRKELMKAYPQVAPFNIFVKGWCKESPMLLLHQTKYDRWLKKIGFSRSFALMSRTGSRSGAMQLMVSFALSGRGIAEVRHIDPKDPCYEDYDADLVEEGIDLQDYFSVQAAYQQDPGGRRCNQTIFDPLYCKKAA